MLLDFTIKMEKRKMVPTAGIPKNPFSCGSFLGPATSRYLLLADTESSLIFLIRASLRLQPGVLATLSEFGSCQMP